MADKSSDWQPGPNVCRCCFAEGCYKDISTEYFWMGKKEVYSDMLLDTFDISIGYSKTQGPNSNSRLICEPCISRLRDATDFKRQVQECERTFMQHLDPGRSSTVEVPLEQHKGEIKLERVKIEEEKSDDDFDAPFDEPFGDDDDDDLDDQPLTKLATKIPKKESEDLLRNLLVKAEKRKAPLKVKVVPAKKVKKKDEPQPTASKAKPVEKKKKGRNTEDIPIKLEDYSEASVREDKEYGNERRAIFRQNIKTILESCTAYPFKYRRGTYLCYFCKRTFLDPEKLREHNITDHRDVKHVTACKPRKYEPIKMDFSTAVCKLCSDDVSDYATLKVHLTAQHGRVIDSSHGESVLPYSLRKDDHRCQICGKHYEMFLSLHKHMNDHYEYFICETCGKRFVTSQRMLNHARTHQRGHFPCKLCDETYPTYSSLYAHVSKIHKSNKRYKCPICDEKFVSYKHRLKHLTTVHDQKTAVFPCPSCPKVFDLCSRRTAHIRFQHLQERNHVCSVCGMKFFTNYELQEHCIKHGGARIYQCDVCKKSYARLKTLREHMRIHNNDRRFMCPVCGQSFIQNCSLKQHVRVHHPTHLKTDMF